MAYYSPFDATQEVGELEYKALQEDFAATQKNAQPAPSTTPDVETFMTSKEEERKQQEQQKTVEQKTKSEVDVAGEALKKGMEENSRLNALEIESYTTQFDQLSLVSKQQNEALINSIKVTYTNRINQMELINRGAVGATNTAQIRSGRARYAPELATGLVSAEERAGIRRISDLDAEMNSMIAQAEQAATSKQFELLNTRMETLNKLREQQTTALTNQYNLAKDFEERAILKAKGELEIQKELISNLQSLTETGAQMSDGDKSKYADALGLSVDFVDQYIDTQQSIFKSKAFDEQVQSATKMIDLLNKIPEGQTVLMLDADGNEVEYTGMKRGKTTTYKEFNKRTNTTTFITLDENGNVINTDSINGMGTPYVGGSGSTTRNTSNTTKTGIIPFDEWLQQKQDTEQFSYNYDPKTGLGDSKVKAMLEAEYEAEFGVSPDYKPESSIKLTNTQYNNGFYNFKQEEGGTEAKFQSLSPEEQLTWSKFQPSTDTEDTSSASSDEEEARKLLGL